MTIGPTNQSILSLNFLYGLQWKIYLIANLLVFEDKDDICGVLAMFG